MVRTAAANSYPGNSSIASIVVMRPALCRIEAYFGPEHADTFRRDLALQLLRLVPQTGP